MARSKFKVSLLALTALFLAGCVEDKAGNWATSDTYIVGDLEFDAPRALVPSISAYPKGHPLETDFDTTKRVVRGVALHINFWSHVPDTSHRDICARMDDGWAKTLCLPENREFAREYPEFDLYEVGNDELFGYHRTLTNETVLDHFQDMQFDQGPLQVACDRQYLEEGEKKRRTCTVRLFLTDRVFAYWKFGFINWSEDEVSKTLSRVCNEGEAVHLWFTDSLGKIPKYGVEPPKCPAALSARSAID